MRGKDLDNKRAQVVNLIEQQGQDVFAHLLQAPDLLRSERADHLQRNLSSESIEQWTQILKGEAYKVERLEASFAVVGTMKSGKSTTINAIVGTEVLPNRNQPMTTLPTVIRHCPDKREPELTFSDPKPFNELLVELRRVLLEKQNAGDLDKLSFCSTAEGKELITSIIDGSFRAIQSHYRGQNDIFLFLKAINDIWRLCSIDGVTIDLDGYLKHYDDIAMFPSIEVEFAHLRGQAYRQDQGSLALIDTPGPNEAGQTFLKHIMREQLEKASAVLVILDYTQLNAEAEAEMRKSLEEVADVTGGRLFVFVNKFDQKDRNGMDAETLRSYVVKQLFENRIDKDHVYPVSSKYGYLANRALAELHMFGRLPDYRFSPWVEDFGALAMGAFWESELDDFEEVKNRATKLWKNSLFDKPLDEVVKKGYENAAIMSLRAAVAKMLEYDKRIIESLQFRKSAINTDIATLESNIKSLEEDILVVKDAREDARYIIDECTKNLQKKVYELFDKIEAVVYREIGAMIELKKRDSWVNKRLEGFVDNSGSDAAHIAFDPEGYNDFASEEEAAQFLDKLIETVANHIEPLLGEMQKVIKNAVDEMAEDIWRSVNSRLETVLQTAEQRLNESFSVVMDFPRPDVRAFVVDFDMLRDSSITPDAVTKTGTRYEKKWYTLWCHDHAQEFQYQEQVFRIHANNIVEQLKEIIDRDSNEIWTSLDKYVRNEFSIAIKSYFAEIADYLERFRGDLMDAKNDRELESESLENLQNSMSEILARAIAHAEAASALADFPNSSEDSDNVRTVG